MTKKEFYNSIGPVVNKLDLTIWHSSPEGEKLVQLGIHVCRKGTPIVDYVYRTIHMSTERSELIKSEDLDALLRFDAACKKAREEIHTTVIDAFGSLDNIDLVAPAEGSGVIH